MSNTGRPPGQTGDGLQTEGFERDRSAERTAALRPPIIPAGVGRSDDTAPMPAVQPVTDQLAEIRWVDVAPTHEPANDPSTSDPFEGVSFRPRVQGQQAAQPQTSPPQARRPQAQVHSAQQDRELTADAVGRSAWDRDLNSISSSEPDGWDKLSWTDLDEGRRTDANEPKNADFGGTFGSSPTWNFIREWAPVLIAAVAIALFTRLVLVQAYHIPSLSMAPTLQDGDRVVVNRHSYSFGEIERGQIVVFSTPPSQQSEANDLIKRVIGLPGEKVQFHDGEVYVDGMLVQEPYLAQQRSTRAKTFDIPGCADETTSPDQCTVPDGFVFVMGDNRTGSQDSRVFGPIPKDTIVGRAMVRVWPLTEIQGL